MNHQITRKDFYWSVATILGNMWYISGHAGLGAAFLAMAIIVLFIN